MSAPEISTAAVTETPAAVENSIVITAYGTPVTQGSIRSLGAGRPSVHSNAKRLKPWRVTVKEAALDALPSRDVDAHWLSRGPCLVCAVPGVDARHRVMDAVVDAVRAGDDAESVAENYGVTTRAVEVAVAAATWPLTGPVAAGLVFCFARPSGHYGTGRNSGQVRPGAPSWPANKGSGDIEKLVRAVFDALTDAAVWRDDSQVVIQWARKAWVGDVLDRPGVRIEVRTVDRG